MSTVHPDHPGGLLEPRFETLAELVQAVTGSLELSDALDRVAQAATQLISDSAARIWVVEHDRLILRAEAGTRGRPGSGRQTEMAFGAGYTGQAAETREAVLVGNVLTDPRGINVDWMREQGFVSLAALPLLVQERLVGVATVLTRHRHEFAAQELKLLRLFGSQAAIAIQLRSRQARIEALLDVGSQLSRIQPVESLLARIAEVCGRLFHSNSVTIRLVEGDELVVKAIWGHSEEVLPSGRLKVGQSLTGIVAATGQPLVVRGPTSDSRLSPDHHEGYRSARGPGVPRRAGSRAASSSRASSASGPSPGRRLLGRRRTAGHRLRLSGRHRDRERPLVLPGARAGSRPGRSAGRSARRSGSTPARRNVSLTAIAREAARLLDVDNAGFRLLEGDELVVAGLARHRERDHDPFLV